MFTRVVQKYTFVSKSRELFKFMKKSTQKNSTRLVENWQRKSTLNFWGCETRKTIELSNLAAHNSCFTSQNVQNHRCFAFMTTKIAFLHFL